MLSALLQLAVTPVVAVAEGRFAEQAGLAYAHVEAEHSTTCVAAHPDDCALCQFLSSSVAPQATGAALLVLGTVQRAPSAAVRRVGPLTGRGIPPTRAPPVPG